MHWKCLSIVSEHVHRKLKQGNKITAGMHKEMVRIEGFYLEANWHLSLAIIFSRAFTCECHDCQWWNIVALRDSSKTDNLFELIIIQE